MQTYYQSQSVHPDILNARVCGARGAPDDSPRRARAAGRAGDFLSRAPGNPCESLFHYWISVLILNLDLTFRTGTTLHTYNLHAIICAPRPKNHIVMPRAPLAPGARAFKCI